VVKRRTLFTTLAVSGLATLGCTPDEVQGWLAWHAQDPAAAVEFANRPDVAADFNTGEHLQVETNVADIPSVGLRNDHGDAVWNKIARCESGGRWDYPPVKNRSGTYSGGLMIGHQWWPAFGGTEFAPFPYLATRAEQIHVAEAIADANGLDGGWQCYP
jgi:hypothetical protein